MIKPLQLVSDYATNGVPQQPSYNGRYALTAPGTPTDVRGSVSQPFKMHPPDDVSAPVLGPADMTGWWWVAQVKPQHEKRVAQALVGIEDLGWYLPMYVPDSTERKKPTPTPLLNGYIFACCNSDKAFCKLDDLRGPRSVQRIIRVNDQRRFVRELSSLHRATVAGTVRPYRLPVVGQRCRITRGPLEGTEGKLIRTTARSLFVLGVENFGAAELEVSPDMLEIVDDVAA